MKKYIKWIICLICMVLFLILAYSIKTNKDIMLDEFIYSIVSKVINNNLTSIVKFITNIGSSVSVILITILALIVLKNKKIGLFLSLNLIVITIFQYILKAIFARLRPIDINLIEVTGFSFPSGHSLTAMAFFGFIIYLVYNSSLKYKKVYIIALIILILLIGLSRIYLGVHYPTDVLGGFTFSISYLIIYISLIKKYLKLK